MRTIFEVAKSVSSSIITVQNRCFSKSSYPSVKNLRSRNMPKNKTQKNWFSLVLSVKFPLKKILKNWPEMIQKGTKIPYFRPLKTQELALNNTKRRSFFSNFGQLFWNENLLFFQNFRATILKCPRTRGFGPTSISEDWIPNGLRSSLSFHLTSRGKSAKILEIFFIKGQIWSLRAWITRIDNGFRTIRFIYQWSRLLSFCN